MASRMFFFDVTHPGEKSAGIPFFTDAVTIIIASGDPGGIEGEFEEFICKTLNDWYDGAKVTCAERRIT
jgi:hypothetical protein